jgi:peptidoglycan/xylan/chitin deacetylase (PgdA/CDA1 family)
VDEVKKKYQYITRTLKSIRDMEFRGLRNQFLSFMSKLAGVEPYWDCLGSLLKIEKKYNVYSTFFFLNEKAEVKLFEPSSWRHYGRKFNMHTTWIVEKMKKLEEEGWEVGVHGSYYSYDNEKMLKEEKKELDNLLGTKTSGIRQHCLNLKVPDTFISQDKAGFKYDSTLGCNESPCFRWATCFPFHILEPKKKRKLHLLEIPLIIEDTALHRTKNTLEECTLLIDIVGSYGGVLTLLWHHTAFDKYECPGWAEEYEQIIKLCQSRNAWITHGRSIHAWWSEREFLMPSLSINKGKLEIVPNTKNICYMDIFSPKDSACRVLELKGKSTLKL